MIMTNRPVAERGPTEPQPRFEVGQLVRHRRYRYRGVIVAFDACCQADEAWYQSNKTQPSKKQPWYHVLVHESASTTYAAQDSLIEDHAHEPIDHPLVEAFFTDFADGRYIRNDRPWPTA